LLIRAEVPEDHEAIANVTARAFGKYREAHGRRHPPL